MTKREFFEVSGLLILGGALGIFHRDLLFNPNAERRFALYNIRRDLNLRMSRKQVEDIIKQHDAPYIEKQFESNEIRLTVKLGLIDELYLIMMFSNENLIQARFAGEDHPFDVPKDAPQNLE